MAVNISPGFDLQPSAQQVPVETNYIKDFDFLNQYLPDTYEKEFERYGNRSISSFLRMVGAEMPSNSDLIKWAEQGRLHIKYKACTSAAAAGTDSGAVWTIPNNLTNFNPALATPNTARDAKNVIRVGQTVMISDNTPGSSLTNKAIVTAGPTNANPNTFTVAYYEAAGQSVAAGVACDVFIYGSEFAKGTEGMVGSL